MTFWSRHAVASGHFVRDYPVMLGDVALDLPCPNCSTQMYAEQAHNRCPSCLYIEPCCDGAPQPCRVPADARH